MNRDWIRSLIERRTDEMPDAPDAAQMDDFGSPASIITTSVDVGDFLGQKRAAMAAHASQIPPDSFFLSMPLEAFAEAFGVEWFIRRGAPGNRETWLFDDL